MRKLMVLAAMLAMMMVATAPAMAQTTDHDDGDLVDFPACFPSCEDNSFEDGFLLVSLDEGVFDDIDFDSDNIDFDSDDIDIDFDDNDSDIDFDDIDSDDNDSDDNDSDRNNNDGNNNRDNNGGNGGRN